MRRSPRRAALVVALTVIGLARPRLADACSPLPCAGWTALEIHHKTPIPADGVIVLRARLSGGPPTDADLAAIAVTVTGPGGVVLDGALEVAATPDALLWRPAIPFAASTPFDLAITVDNTGYTDRCDAPPAFAVNGQVLVGDASLAAAFLPTITAEAAAAVTPSYQFEDIACCDDGQPNVGSCSIDEWGECASIRGRARIDATFTADLAALAAAGDQVALLGFDLDAGAALLTSETDAPCITPTAIVHATGETLLGTPICAGQELVDQLGPVDVDANEALASCMEPPRNCATSQGEWDESACEPWDGWAGGATGGVGDGEEAGCGCDGGDPSLATLGLLVIPLARRRRG